MRLERHVLADRSARLPMPDRGGRLFDASDRGETIDVENAFWAERIRAGELVKAEDFSASRAAPRASPAGPAAVRRKAGGLPSQPRPAAENEHD